MPLSAVRETDEISFLKGLIFITELNPWPSQDNGSHMPESIFPPTPPATPPSSEHVGHPNHSTSTEEAGQPSCHTCHTCNKSYISRAKLNEHINFRHSEARPHTCSQCPKVFKSASNLKQHVKCAHERPRFTCPDCPSDIGKSFFLGFVIFEYFDGIFCKIVGVIGPGGRPESRQPHSLILSVKGSKYFTLEFFY